MLNILKEKDKTIISFKNKEIILSKNLQEAKCYIDSIKLDMYQKRIENNIEILEKIKEENVYDDLIEKNIEKIFTTLNHYKRQMDKLISN